MESLSNLWGFTLPLIVACALSTPVAAGRIALRPLSASELRSAFIQSNERSLSSALAGIKGFALGLTNGIGGALLFDVATSNETIAYLTDAINNWGSTTDGGGGATQQEVCFASRSANGDLIQARHNERLEADEDEENLEKNDDFYDDEVEDTYQDQNRDQLSRQVDYDYVTTGVGGGGGSITCIVVNRGRALIRHRRSTPSELEEVEKAVNVEAEVEVKERDRVTPIKTEVIQPSTLSRNVSKQSEELQESKQN